MTKTEKQGAATPKLAVATQPEGKIPNFKVVRELSSQEYKRYKASGLRISHSVAPIADY